MSPERWQHVKSVLYAALEHDSAARTAFLNEACRDDLALREEVESLLASYEEDPGFIETAAPLAAGLPDRPDPDALPDTIVGHYRLVRPIAFGGMGAVYLAAHESDATRGQVAVKLLRFDRYLAGPSRRADMLRRFRSERRVLAHLHHPNIARLLDGGTHRGIPYLVMEYIEGERIDRYCDTRRLPVTERLHLFATVCAAVHWAHQHLVVHRDLKPGNILVTPSGRPMLLDFGIAKILAADDEPAGAPTLTDLQLLTPEYASPEQARGERVTTASDVYSLGVVLYELLTGHGPYRLDDVPRHERARLLLEQSPEKPSSSVLARDEGTTTSSSLTREGTPERLQRRLRGDLDMIVLKALRKEPERRYASAEQLSEDIARHLEGRPVIARPDRMNYRLAKFARRHALAVFLGAAIVVVLLASAVTLAALAQAARRERDRAEQYSQFLDNLLATANPLRVPGDTGGASAGGGADLSVRAVLDVAAQRASTLRDQPLAYAQLLDALGRFYRNFGMYDRAERHLSEAVSIRRRELGPEHLQTLESSSHLALVHRDQGRYREAEPALVTTLEARRRRLGEQHRDTLMAMNDLALLHQDQGRYAEAEALLSRAMALRPRVLDEEDQDTLRLMSTLAGLHLALGRFDESERLYQRTLAVRRRVLHEEHPDTLASMSDLATAYVEQGRYGDAEGLFDRTLETCRRVLGKAHPVTLSAMSNLAWVQYRQSRHAEAEDLYVETLEAQRRSLGEEHPGTVATMSALALLYTSVARYAEAEQLYREALAIRRRDLGEEHPGTLSLRTGLAELRYEEGRLEEARQILMEVIEVRREALGPDHPATLTTMHDLGVMNRDLRHYEEAEKLFADTLERRRRVLGDHHLGTLRTMANLAVLYRRQKQFEKAEALYLDAIDGARRSLREGHAYTGMILHSYGWLLLGRGRLDEAEPVLLEAHELVRAAFGPRHKRTRWCLEALVGLYDARSEPEEAARYGALLED